MDQLKSASVIWTEVRYNVLGPWKSTTLNHGTFPLPVMETSASKKAPFVRRPQHSQISKTFQYKTQTMQDISVSIVNRRQARRVRNQHADRLLIFTRYMGQSSRQRDADHSSPPSTNVKKLNHFIYPHDVVINKHKAKITYIFYADDGRCQGLPANLTK